VISAFSVALLLAIKQCGCDHLFMSCHDNPNIIAWDVTSSALATEELLDTSSIDWVSSDDLRFRGMAINDGVLYVANSKKSSSFIGEWSCESHRDKLSFIGNFTGLNGYNPGLVHPYGIRWHEQKASAPDLYVSAQNTQSVLKYDSNGIPDADAPNDDAIPGSVATFGPPDADENSKGVRDVEVDVTNGLLFVAQQALQMVLVYSADGDFTNLFNISYADGAEPVGLSVDEKHHPNVLFVGDNGGPHDTDTGGPDNGYDALYAFKYDSTGYEMLWRTERLGLLDHPAGIAVNEHSVFVVSQNKNLILRFDAENGQFVDEFADFEGMDVLGENLLYVEDSDCQSIAVTDSGESDSSDSVSVTDSGESDSSDSATVTDSAESDSSDSVLVTDSGESDSSDSIEVTDSGESDSSDSVDVVASDDSDDGDSDDSFDVTDSGDSTESDSNDTIEEVDSVDSESDSDTVTDTVTDTDSDSGTDSDSDSVAESDDDTESEYDIFYDDDIDTDDVTVSDDIDIISVGEASEDSDSAKSDSEDSIDVTDSGDSDDSDSDFASTSDSDSDDTADKTLLNRIESELDEQQEYKPRGDETVMVSLSGETLANLWGILGVFTITNLILCIWCNVKAQSGRKRVRFLEDRYDSEIPIEYI